VFPDQQRQARNPLALRLQVAQNGTIDHVGIVPDLVFGLRFPDGSRRCFAVEIDRGTMPITRTDSTKTSFERKMRGYLHAHAAKTPEHSFGWRTFRVLTVTTDKARLESMRAAVLRLHIPNSPGPSLFFFITRDELGNSNPMVKSWTDGHGRTVR